MKVTAIITVISVLVAVQNSRAESFIVFGVDRTEAYAFMTRVATAIAIDYVRNADQGDELIARYISDNSYGAGQILSHLQVPVADLPVVNGAFDWRGKKSLERAKALHIIGVAQVKKRALAGLMANCPRATSRTDIVGFLAAAVEDFRLASGSQQKRLVLATDLVENTFFNANLDFHDVVVTVYVLNGPVDPAVADKLRREWMEKFLQWGANSVEFLRPSLEQSTWENSSCTR